MKNFDNIWYLERVDRSFFLEKSDLGYTRMWLDKGVGMFASKEFWETYDCVDTGFHKSEVEAYKLFCKL